MLYYNIILYYILYYIIFYYIILLHYIILVFFLGIGSNYIISYHIMLCDTMLYCICNIHAYVHIYINSVYIYIIYDVYIKVYQGISFELDTPM